MCQPIKGAVLYQSEGSTHCNPHHHKQNSISLSNAVRSNSEFRRKTQEHQRTLTVFPEPKFNRFNGVYIDSQRFSIESSSLNRFSAIQTRTHHPKDSKLKRDHREGRREEEEVKKIARFESEKRKEAIPAYQKRFKAKDRKKRFGSPSTNTGNAQTSPHFHRNHYRIQNDVNL